MSDGKLYINKLMNLKSAIFPAKHVIIMSTARIWEDVGNHV